MPDTHHSAPGRRRDIPAWPPYVARTDDEDDVFAADSHHGSALDGTAIITWQPQPGASREWSRAGPSAVPRQRPGRPASEKSHRCDAQSHADGFSSRVPFEGEVLFADIDPAMRRAVSHRPIIALTVNALGYHLFISHAARRALGRLMLIGLGALIALLWGDLTDVAELLLGVFVH
ncbi:MAG: hypothetical protein OZ934_02480 [Anaerolineae bacterium]|nr:hypothetical protein [Anaerolineae bacterium]